jgi:hypothetical protein
MNKYQSKYSPNKEATSLQYICEIICEKNAKQTGRELPVQFWQLSQWEKFYKSQICLAKKLLDNYSDAAIIKALRDKRTDKIWSLGAPWLIPVIKEYQSKIDKQVIEIKEDNIGGDKFTRPDIKKNLLDKLDE